MRAADLHRLARTLREIALTSTGNTGADQVNAGELAVVEDVSRNPGATISDVTRRTGLAQSLVSRITHRMADAGIMRLRPDERDRRKSRLEIEPSARTLFRARADGSIASALAAFAPKLSAAQRKELTRHLAEAERLLREGQE
ncbi:MarR family winged helix-turn-helix transcriptional regulator [Amycolatopsis rubida]|uniref:DNA-binding transcriptional regulator, MarR family n=1 Tax=Amycolatopsis rubida TaxID=112413 RepID=A0A1I5Z9M8_9PSEU|nr:helix-turn-helix domain-containing protein [Amycolatopsis rubida]SFQ53134.1 DNA-binding transcriptional regulator, MarR family [Amycolatopsis rubida]